MIGKLTIISLGVRGGVKKWAKLDISDTKNMEN